jgi:hypothetical protein
MAFNNHATAPGEVQPIGTPTIVTTKFNSNPDRYLPISISDLSEEEVMKKSVDISVCEPLSEDCGTEKSWTKFCSLYRMATLLWKKVEILEKRTNFTVKPSPVLIPATELGLIPVTPGQSASPSSANFSTYRNRINAPSSTTKNSSSKDDPSPSSTTNDPELPNLIKASDSFHPVSIRKGQNFITMYLCRGECGYESQYLQNVRRHYNSACSNNPNIKKEFLCDHCSMELTSDQTKKRHMVACYGQNKLVNCPCGKEFKRNYYLLRHQDKCKRFLNLSKQGKIDKDTELEEFRKRYHNLKSEDQGSIKERRQSKNVKKNHG